MNRQEQSEYFDHMYQHYRDCGYPHAFAMSLANDAVDEAVLSYDNEVPEWF